MELKQLKIFQVAARELNFTRTAEILHYAQSSVTAQVKSLEEELAVQLFDRLGKRVILTDAGKRFKLYTDKVLDLTEEAKETVGGNEEPSGTLTICASETQCTYRLPALLKLFQARFPKVKLIFRPGISENDFEDLLAQGLIDAVLISMTRINSDKLIAEQLVAEPIVIVSPPNHPLADKSEVRPADLNSQSLLFTEKCDYRNIFEASLVDAAVQPLYDLELGDIEAIKKCVMAGIGIAALPKLAVEKEIEEGSMSVLRWKGPEFPIVTQLVWHKDKWVSPALSAFLDVSREVILDH
ncbi:LysR family transcriptional regulator [Priestia megaterium]|uniref:LysR family transcriptional regulator n=1 Tax=Priestia megaterium TaxID=1404 RepID=UPI000BF9E891|nr:LysR family transcriptional regulator [Priestia megaterium]MED4232929.1 LysR family transcriptional regulator [Priestia megaterium]NGY74982.1 LysR family transcriptional regulator [Priestia megaterium]PES91557.1 LysR family transcriptional regulator [Priestia megaterium]PEX08280.1 LysR family transcriptional regulator [Priestia megaterium]